MKRTIALLLVLALAFGLTACSKEDKDISGKVTPATEAAPAITEPAPETTEAPAEDKPVSLGRMEGGVYTNEYIGIGCTLDANWTFKTAEELQELPAQTGELLQDTEYADASLNQIADMFAENISNGSNINIQYTKLDMQVRLIYAAMDYEAFADMIMSESDSMIQAYTQTGFENVAMEKVTINYLGEERVAIRTTADFYDVPLYMLQVFEHNLGKYYAVITFTSVMEDTTQSMADLFYAID